MGEDRKRSALRAFVNLYTPLKWALYINDCICYLFKSLIETLWWAAQFIFKLILKILGPAFAYLGRFFSKFQYKPLDLERTTIRPHIEPIPYRKQFLKRSITYAGGLILGAILYLFVYYVLVKHHNATTIAVALLLMLAYLVILENSHSIRSIIMLCLPIMFTNRGRALVFCSMLTILVAGPIKNTQINVKELHSSLNCCRQYLIIKSDKYVDQNVVQQLVKVEDVINKLVKDIKQFAEEVSARFRFILQLAITVEQYISAAIDKLKEIINICNSHTADVYNNCLSSLGYAYLDCRAKLGPRYDPLCEIVKPLSEVCSTVKIPDVLCEVPAAIINYLDKTIGQRLRYYLKIIEHEFYVEVEVEHEYKYNGTKSKSYRKVFDEIKFDVKQKFWYIHLIARVFNLVSLILVTWILITATLYHMHYVTELGFDNMYIDGYLKLIDDQKSGMDAESARKDRSKSRSLEDYDEKKSFSKEKSRERLLPLLSAHQDKYLKPFSIYMNEVEMHKLQIAGIVWLIITGYIFFFVALDFALYNLLQLVTETLDEILFKSDLPLVDISSRSGDQVVRYNRTYLAEMRKRRLLTQSVTHAPGSYRKGGLSARYRRLMDSIEKKIPDDVAILDSMQPCLPTPTMPDYAQYKLLLYLGMFTFVAVIVEAYAMRTRHCIANLYYPIRAKKRAFWLYEKLTRERPKFENPEQLEEEDNKSKLLDFGLKFVMNKAKK